MDFNERYRLWCESEYFDFSTREELRSIADEKEIEERFYCDLKFGTGGMRGIMGAGTNRLNKYTIGRATAGLGAYLTDNFSDKDLLERGVAIAYDTRHNSHDYAEDTANILTRKGIKVYIFDKPVPTPELSFAIRYLNCIAGVVITASHNTKEYNGYKVYDSDGGQLVNRQVKQLVKYINPIEDYTSIDFAGNPELKQYIDITDEFTDAVIASSKGVMQSAKNALRVAYTPLHGTGNIPVRAALKKSGFKNVYTVKAQQLPDGDFPTVKSPNPEDDSAMSMVLNLGKEKSADIALGTDPDCDRVGVGVRQPDGSYRLLTGNQIGALIVDYVVRHTDLSKIKKPAVIKTVVTSDLGAEAAKAKGVKVFETLTGFKFIGEKITQFEKAKNEGDTLRNYDFVVGYEESFGYLAGDYARDKDGVGPSLVICEMAAEYKALGLTLTDRLEQLYKEFGYYLDARDSFTFEGIDGIEKMSEIMNSLRSGGLPFDEISKVIDYSKGIKAEDGFGKLPKSNVIKFVMRDGSWIAVRPSGTEPKIKIYYSIKGGNREEAENKLHKYRKAITDKIKLG